MCGNCARKLAFVTRRTLHDDTYYFPPFNNSRDGILGSIALKTEYELWSYVVWFGFPEICRFNEVSEVCHLSLGQFLIAVEVGSERVDTLYVLFREFNSYLSFMRSKVFLFLQSLPS